MPDQLVGTSNDDSGSAPSLESFLKQAQFDSTPFENVNTDPPGLRLQNPLGSLSSYTYQITLYMVTPDAYDAFIQTGRKSITALNSALLNGGISGSGGAFVVAQSGGVNLASTPRAPGFDFDYGIDNLTFTTTTNAKATGISTNTTEIKFNITEPYGLSFITKLRAATETIQAYRTGTAFPQNPLKQFFILGIRFYGYDDTGNIVDGNELVNGRVLDPNSNNNAIFEQFYDIIITDLKFKLDGHLTTYNISAASLAPQTAMTVKRGIINNNTPATGSTVGEMINNLFETLNNQQIDEKTQGARLIPNTYKVVFVDNIALDQISPATFVNNETIDQYKYRMSNANTTIDSNATTSLGKVPNSKYWVLSFNSTTSILQAINDIIKQSSYLKDALNLLYTTSTDSNSDEVSNTAKNSVKWYNCSAEIANAKWDSLISDWAFDITYKIQSYLTPIVDSVYAKTGINNYYGPHKRYSYWYTGKNSEILQYEQSMDNTYFNVVLSDLSNLIDQNNIDNDTNAATGSPINLSQTPNLRTPQSRTGSQGNSLEAQNNYVTSLYDPGAWAEAKITILGDPDYLMSESISSINQVYNRFYGSDGFTINPNGGQVFIEIDFKEAVDYSMDAVGTNLGQNDRGIKGAPGTMSINDSIQFWKYPDSITKQVKGVSYMLISVDSSFSNGAFQQTLHGVINTFGNASDDAQNTRNTDILTATTSTETETTKDPAVNNQTNPGDNSGKQVTPTTSLVEQAVET